MESEVVLSHFLGVMGRWAVTVESDKQGIKDSKSLEATLTTDMPTNSTGSEAKHESMMSLASFGTEFVFQGVLWHCNDNPECQPLLLH